MSAFRDQLAAHQATFVSTEHFGESFTFESNAGADITFAGVLENDMAKSVSQPAADKEDCDARIQCVSAAKYDEMRAAVPDFDKDGWIEMHGDKYSIVGTADRDTVSVTLKLAISKLKIFRSSRSSRRK
ncbi:MAG: hypothetical protein ACKV2Q_24850 [Planctomycetaceae bacterium]